MATETEWCPYEVNHLEKRGICNLCGLPKSEHVTLWQYNRAEGYKVGREVERNRIIEIIKNMLWKKELDHQKKALIIKIREGE